MNKKGKKKTTAKIDGNEDLEIKSIAYFKNSSQVILLVVLIILFGFTLYSTLVFIGDYYMEKNNEFPQADVVQINNDKNRVLIINNGKIDKVINDADIKGKDDIVIENYSSIELSTNKEAEVNGTMEYDLRYNITRNDFPYNTISTNDSDVLVRFSYSYDNEEWEYLNNVISTDSSTLSPMMGHYYDISGVTSNLKVLTNHTITSKPGEKIKLYWKSETIILNKSSNINKGINAEFKIEYKNNA